MNIIDTSEKIPDIFEKGRFDLTKWGSYMDSFVPGAREVCLRDMKGCIGAGYSWDRDILPVLESAASSEKLTEAVSSFRFVTGGLEEKILSRFSRTIDVDIVLYLGLCNGAGWVTEIGGKTYVLLGIEKILELNWCGLDHMNGLILHELGHAYHSQYGNYASATESASDAFIRKLFNEGVAMVFEQELVGDAEYFHQDRGGWKEWCDLNYGLIRNSFLKDLDMMTFADQRYFGDRVSFEGRPDTGYYLGTRLVRSLMQDASFDEVINYDIATVKEKLTEERP